MSKADPAREQTIQFKSIKSPPLEGNQFISNFSLVNFSWLWLAGVRWMFRQSIWTEKKDIRAVLEKGLKENYSEVSVSIVECPDLTEEPFGLAAKGKNTFFYRTWIGHFTGICGSTRLADVGGVPYLVPGPAAWRERTYNFNHVAKQTDVPGAHVLGACAGSKHYVQVNSGKFHWYEVSPVIFTGNSNFRMYPKHSNRR